MKFAIVTLGCKVNQYESASLAAMMTSRGHSQVPPESADAVIINTCAVTGESARKSRQAARRARTLNSRAVIAVCGCFSQVEPETAAALGADIVFGSGEKAALLNAIERKVAGAPEKITSIPDMSRDREFEDLPGGAAPNRARATLKVEDGCDRFCSYCMIPLARGRVRSMPFEAAIEAARRYEAEGYRELVITGIEIASYGKDFGDRVRVADLIESIAIAAPVLRIRLGSLEPTIIDRDFARRLAETGRVCPHFHLSLQSGSDGVLRVMRRGYDTARFYEAVQLLRGHFSGCAIAADLITGFPGETEEQHAETLDFIRKCRFSSMHIFPYSERSGTLAAELPGALPRSVKTARAREAGALAAELEREYLEAQVGRTLEVLFETDIRGHADNYALVEVGAPARRGEVGKVKITGIRDEILCGEGLTST